MTALTKQLSDGAEKFVRDAAAEESEVKAEGASKLSTIEQLSEEFKTAVANMHQAVQGDLHMADDGLEELLEAMFILSPSQNVFFTI